MNIRKTLASMAIATTLIAGYAGVASAETTNPPTHEHHFNCDSARDHLAHLRQHIDAVKDRITKAQARVAELRRQGKEDQAERLAKRVEAAKDKLAKLETRLAKLEARIDQRCATDAK